MIVLMFAASAVAQNTTSGPLKVGTTKRPAGQRDVIELRCEPIKASELQLLVWATELTELFTTSYSSRELK